MKGKIRLSVFEIILITLSIFPFTPQIFHFATKATKKPAPSVKVPAGL